MLGVTPTAARVLLADMTWAPVATLEPGQRVITFDATPTDSWYRLYRVGTITGIQRKRASTFQVNTADTTITVGTDHEFLAKKWKKSLYRTPDQLEAGDGIFWFAPRNEYAENDAYQEGYVIGAFCGDGSVPEWKNRVKDPKNTGSYISSVDEEIAQTVVRYAENVCPEFKLELKQRRYNNSPETAMMPVAPGETDKIIRDKLTAEYPSNDEDFARGFLAGMLDTDGTYPKAKELCYCQYEGEIFDQVCEYLDLLNYEWSHDEGKKGDFSSKIRLTPGRETGRVFEHLLEIRPKVSRKRLAFAGNRRIGGQTTITSIEPVGQNTVCSVSTTQGTVITEGMLSKSNQS